MIPTDVLDNVDAITFEQWEQVFECQQLPLDSVIYNDIKRFVLMFENDCCVHVFGVGLYDADALMLGKLSPHIVSPTSL